MREALAFANQRPRPGLPKRFQTFLFFRIRKPDQFKLQLKAFVPEITTAETAWTWKSMRQKEKLQYPKGKRPSDLLPKTGVNISFSSTGLTAVSRQIRHSSCKLMPVKC